MNHGTVLVTVAYGFTGLTKEERRTEVRIDGGYYLSRAILRAHGQRDHGYKELQYG